MSNLEPMKMNNGTSTGLLERDLVASANAESELLCALRVLQRIMLRTRIQAQRNISPQSLDDIFDYTDYLYNIAIQERHLDGKFRRVLEDATKRFPTVFAGMINFMDEEIQAQ